MRTAFFVFIMVFATLHSVRADARRAEDPSAAIIRHQYEIATDFYRHLDRMAEEERRRQAGAEAWKERRERDEERTERIRQRYVETRPVVDERKEEYIERRLEMEKAREDRRREALRRRYLWEQYRIRQALRRGPKINERLEWGL